MSRCTWLICESTERWRRAIDRFAPTMLPEGFQLVTATVDQVRQARQPAGGMIVLYELAVDHRRPILQALAHCARRSPAPLQIVALDPHVRLDDQLRARLTAALRQLGAAVVLRHPEQLPRVGRLVNRYARARGSSSETSRL